MLTMKLILDRLDREGKLLERREQPAKSFTKSFIELLYVTHAQTTHAMTDIRGAPVNIDSAIGGQRTSSRGHKSTLALGSPPGQSQIMHPTGVCESGGPYELLVELIHEALLGEHLGIQIGVGTTAVTPTDYALESRIGHGVRPADGVNATFESYTTGDNDNNEIYLTKWAAQYFRAQHQHKLYSVKIKAYRENLPGTITVDIYACDETGKPSGTALVTGTTDGDTFTTDPGGEWREITFPSQPEIIPGLKYAIVVHCGGGSTNSLHWLFDTTANYPRGGLLTSANGGSSWTGPIATDCFMFEEIGRSIGELQYGGCELYGLTFSDPNGEFTIRRYFTNQSGESRTINEAGMYAAASDYATATYPIGIAHDIVSPGVAVADTELLRATYVPQITV